MAFATRHRRRFGLLAAAGLALSALAIAASALAPDDGATKTVRLVIDYNDGVEKHFTAVPWKDGMTVLDAMNFAKAGPHGITFEFKGSGETAFLLQIDDLHNEGGGGTKKNWVFMVNDKLADRSFGVFELQASDVVRWRFGAYRPAPE